MTLLRKIAATMKMGLTWAVSWIPLAVGSAVALSWSNLEKLPMAFWRDAALAGFLAGGASGLLFSVILAATERQGTIGGLSTRRIVAAGILAGLLPAAALTLWTAARGADALDAFGPMVGRVIVLTSALGAGSAGALLWAARHALALPGENRQGSLARGGPYS